MTELKIIIDGVTHEYVPLKPSDYACDTCTLKAFCDTCDTCPEDCRNAHMLSHLCRIFDHDHYHPTGKYGHFQITNTL